MNCETIHEKMQFFEHEQENNMEQEKKISVAERLSVRTRLDLSQAELQKTQFENEVSLCVVIYISCFKKIGNM